MCAASPTRRIAPPFSGLEVFSTELSRPNREKNRSATAEWVLNRDDHMVSEICTGCGFADGLEISSTGPYLSTKSCK